MSYILKKSLLPSFKMIKNYSKLPFLFRTLTTSKAMTNNYEGDGKTTVTILNREYKHLIMIDAFSKFGFRLNNGIFAVGPLAAFPRTILQWNVNRAEELTPQNFSLFSLLEPKLDILVIGTGDKRTLPNKDVLQYLKSNRINTEILPTFQACSIFNFLNVEGRCVAGAFLPPEHVEIYMDETSIMNEGGIVEDYSTNNFDTKIYK